MTLNYISPMRIALFVATILLFIACKKEPTSWDTQFSLPLVKTELGLDDLFPDSLIEIDDNQNVSLLFEEEILDFELDTLLEIEGDTIQKSFSIAPILQIEVDPGVTFFTVNDDLEFDNIEAQFRLAKIKAGKLIISAQNSINSRLAFELNIPKATLNDVPLLLEDLIPTSINGENGEATFELDLAGYELDLTGESGNDFNKLNVLARISIPSDAETVTVFNTDSVTLDLTYQALEIEYAVGYFGTGHEEIEEGSDFEILESISEAIIDLDNVAAKMTFSNGFGIDVQAYIFELEAWNRSTQNNIALNANMIGSPINLSRGNFDYPNIYPYFKNFYLDNSNSNIVEFVELIPDSIRLQGKVTANPLGNISNYNDFASDESRLAANLALEIPLNLSLSNLIVSDTVAFQWETESPELTQATLYASAINSFPSDIELSILALDANENVVLNLNEYMAPQSSPYITGRIGEINGESLLIYILSENALDLLKQASSMVITASFQTTNYPNRVVFGAEDHLELFLSADIESTVIVK